MTMTDPIADLLSRIRNAHKAKKSAVRCLYSKINLNILEVLKEEGYIRAYQVHPVREGISEIEVELKYFEGMPVIQKIDRVSTPGRRTYSSIESLSKPSNGLGMYVLSTSKGILSDAAARKLNVGGEILCRVF
ncbi:MAG: 30S ribosomal protein S8 [Alphaproteobacteria bacterium RIFCSPHIGHO2_01_FULL_41_14]|nr:MAG: 30S ribosomal protein S8 [Alphaproteobacteria bacterium GWB1_45_5]OFW76034.1 MAG: 30S ribosomal protein S8 [Alphaproteobacteria bacterium GWA1_45_9]OFW90075.1 MAG: 30S ribosomal protein S8 [Alphaproteobacteria bacterium RIFCSPHIGHO2_01_FULL_41_14]HCI48548.1 30S ribosomal protein S8 [Holosporales bacterium]